jgi:PUA-domain protein
MPKKYRRHFLKAKEARLLFEEALEWLKTDLNDLFNSKVSVELVETNFAEIFLINGRPLLVKARKTFFPTLVFNEIFASSPKVVVDMGAVPHICKGADVMAPGIVRFEGEFKDGDLVLVVDERHGKPLAVGKAVYDVNTAKTVTRDVVVKSIHFVGDNVWNFIKNLQLRLSEN